MAQRLSAPELEPYRPALRKWLPQAEIRQPAGLEPFDGVITLTGPGGPIRYLLEEKRHFRHQDAGVVAEQLIRRRAELPPDHSGDRVLLLAPHVRPQQAAILERTGIEYLDLAGNAHLEAPGLFVHVEGRRPPKAAAPPPIRTQTGWIKTVMALLIRPELAGAPYRVLAGRAGVALGTVARCMNDLVVRGLLHEAKQGRRLADRHTLVALWVQAYSEALRPKLEERRFQVRAGDKQDIQARLQKVLESQAVRWALTGADAAERRTHFFRAEDTEIYLPPRVLEGRETQKALIAQPTVRGGNLLVIEPPGPLAIPDETAGGVPLAPGLLVYAELRYRGTGQALEAAELFLPEVLENGGD